MTHPRLTTEDLDAIHAGLESDGEVDPEVIDCMVIDLRAALKVIKAAKAMGTQAVLRADSNINKASTALPVPSLFDALAEWEAGE